MGVSYAAMLVYGVPIEQFKAEQTKYNEDTGEPYQIEVDGGWRLTGTDIEITRVDDDWFIDDTKVVTAWPPEESLLDIMTDYGKGNYLGFVSRVSAYDDPIEVGPELLTLRQQAFDGLGGSVSTSASRINPWLHPVLARTLADPTLTGHAPTTSPAHSVALSLNPKATTLWSTWTPCSTPKATRTSPPRLSRKHDRCLPLGDDWTRLKGKAPAPHARGPGSDQHRSASPWIRSLHVQSSKTVNRARNAITPETRLTLWVNVTR